MVKKISLFAAPLLCLLLLWWQPFSGLNPQAQKVLVVAIFMLFWWLTEAVSLAVTALLPMALFPLLGVMSMDEATAPYSNSVVYLFFGGFVIALALEKWNLHLRIALTIVKWTGTNPNGIILGFMLATGFISMWISNTATTVMMLPIAASVVNLLKDEGGENAAGMKNFALCMMLGIAYGANIGGIATLIGTPPNSVFAAFMKKTYDYEISFVGWMVLATPFSLVLLIIVYFLNVKILFPNRLKRFEAAENLITNEMKKLGKMSKGEKYVLGVFALTAFLWIFRTAITAQFPSLKLTDAGIAVMAAILLFVVPINLKKSEFILHWEDTTKLPWGILLLFGGGLCLADGMEKTGIIALIANTVAASGGADFFVLALSLGVLAIFMTEVMSNVALVTVLLPVVAGIAQGIGLDPLVLAVPVTIGASCAFMLPMATPPNAIVFASGYVRVSQMAKAGFWANIVSSLLTAVVVKILLEYGKDLLL